MPMGGNVRSNRKKIGAFGLVGAIYLVVCIYFPDWTPRCLWRLLSGYDCPACGAQRAIRCFARGDLYAGFWCNPYLIVLLPYISLLMIAVTGSSRTAKLRKWLTRAEVVAGLVLFMLGWWILRNTQLWSAVLEKYGASC